MFIPSFLSDEMDRLAHPLSRAFDVISAIAGLGFISLATLSFIRGIESVIAGALVIVVLALRVAVHLRERRRSIALDNLLPPNGDGTA